MVGTWDGLGLACLLGLRLPFGVLGLGLAAGLCEWLGLRAGE